jgi:anti-sigma regulatory factor (Ser/Thr protein kinase)
VSDVGAGHTADGGQKNPDNQSDKKHNNPLAEPKPMTHKVALTLASDVRDINRASLTITEFCLANALGQTFERTLQLIVEELVSNTVEHGRAPPAAPIDLRFWIEAGQLLLEYVDRGIPFNPGTDLPRDTRELPVEQRAVGGLGWPMILHYCRLTGYRRANDENHYFFTIRVC